jgi:cell wall-associated NlpC family hydrolase
VRFSTRALVLSGVIAAAAAGPANANVTGGFSIAEQAAPAATAAAPGAVEIPVGMRTAAGTRASRYKGKTQDGRTAYFARVPLGAPAEVQQAIVAANKIVGLPYKYGGGHARVQDTGYDCSGTVSYALIGANLLSSPLPSYDFEKKWEKAETGEGQWISVYGNRSHAFAVIAGLRLDTSAARDSSGLKGPQWRPNNRRDHKSFTAVHPQGF